VVVVVMMLSVLVVRRWWLPGGGDGVGGVSGRDGMEEMMIWWFGSWPESWPGKMAATGTRRKNIENVCLSGLMGLNYLMNKVVQAGTAPGPNNSNHNDNNYYKWWWDAENEDISRNNIPRIKFNKWEELAEELML
ncbi:hypothetical protein Tco_0746422, partial [Tanacetum coccineum]